MSSVLVAPLKEGNYRIEQLIKTITTLGNGGYHRNTNHRTESLVVEFGATLLQLVVHIQRHNRTLIEVDELGCEVEVALQVRRHNGIDNHIGHLLVEVSSHIDLLGGVCRQRICAWQVGEVYAITLVG